MYITGLRVLLILVFIMVWYQDIKERQVFWVLFVIISGLCGFLFYNSTIPELFFNAILMNLTFVSTLILIVFMYSKLKLKTRFLNVIGLGDVLLFIGLGFSFSTVSFIVIFISSLFFSLILHLFIKRKSTFNTVPLAGYMSLFFSITYISFWFGWIEGLYTI